MSDRVLELQFRRLLETLPAGAYTCDPEGLITYFNPHAEQLWGRAPKLNDPGERFCGYDGHEMIIERPDGARLTALAHVNPIRDEAGQLLGAVGVLVDITERKRAEDLLKANDRSRNEFLAMLAHELRNPLAAVCGAVEILHHKIPRCTQVERALGVIDRQMRQMARLIDDLLDSARITGNKLEVRKTQIELAEVLEAALETSRPLIEARGHELVVTSPPDPVHLDADVVRLAQAVANLLNNAAKYTEPGGRIELTAGRDGGEAVVTVRDTGVGIPAEMLPRIFEMFTQVKGSLDRAQGGLGVGLTLAKRLVELHGGTITARSDGCGTGSTFTVRLPIAA